jgi:type 1 glutamine amidotransferase
MTSATLAYVTQVAPYVGGPAGVHGVLDQSSTAMAQLAESAGLGFHRVTDVRALDRSVLESARVLALFTIGETPWSEEQRSLLFDAVRAGRTSVLSVHSATDACYGWDDYRLLVGARFDGHPWTRSCTLDVVDPDHPAVSHLGDTWYWHDEVYTFRDLRPDASVLLRARPEELFEGEHHGGDRPAPTEPAFGFPLSWCFTEGSGRVFSTSLGHFPQAWENIDYLRHLAGGLDWITTPAPSV